MIKISMPTEEYEFCNKKNEDLLLLKRHLLKKEDKHCHPVTSNLFFVVRMWLLKTVRDNCLEFYSNKQNMYLFKT